MPPRTRSIEHSGANRPSYTLDAGGDIDHFRKVQAAHNLLSDSRKRCEYDAYGSVDPVKDRVQVELLSLLARAMQTDCDCPITHTLEQLEKHRRSLRAELASCEVEIARLNSRLKSIKSNNKSNTETVAYGLCVEAAEGLIKSTKMDQRRDCKRD